MKRSLQLFLVMMFSVFFLAARGGNNEETEANENDEDVDEDAEYIIGGSQIMVQTSLGQSSEGFQAAIDVAGLVVSFEYQNAQDYRNNVETISNDFVADDVDLIFAISTPSALGALNATPDI